MASMSGWRAAALFMGVLAAWFCPGRFAQAQTDVIAASVGDDDTPFILDSTGKVWGFSTPDHLDGWVQIAGLPPVRQLVPFAALTQDGRVFTWGLTQPASSRAQAVSYTAPLQVAGLSDVAAIFGGDSDGTDGHFLALLRDGRVAMFGRSLAGSQGVAGDPAVEIVPAIANAVSAAVSDASETVLTSDGYAYSWGQLRLDGGTQFHAPASPVKIFVGADKQFVYGNADYVAALSGDGTLHHWGMCVSGAANSGMALAGVTDNVLGVRKYVKTARNEAPDVYLLYDGRVAVAYPPGRSWAGGACTAGIAATM
ncbi:MAG TPA: hypothetical protein VEQ16_00075, partial [Acidocella sp.]|nr:hypothetical protein [Acidocella sp.]